MTLIHGHPIKAEYIEKFQLCPKDFVSLCNTITWALADNRCTSLPSFTERHNVKDGGIDAEWINCSDTISSPLLKAGWNVLQYKWRDIFASDRNSIFSGLKASLRGAVQNLYKITGHHPDNYVVFTNLDLTHNTKAQNAATPQKAELKKSILENYDLPDSVKVEIVGAAELAAFLNDLPHIRSAFFSTSSFMTWQKAWSTEIENEKLYCPYIELIGRDKELNQIRSFVDNSDVRVITISGTQGIGKTRLVLEATEHRQIETVIALDPHSMSVTDLLNLESPNLETLVIIDDPDPEKVEIFAKKVILSKKLKLLLTLPTSEHRPRPHFGLDPRVKILSLTPILEHHSREILKAVRTDFNYGVESWIVKQAGGNPGILLHAAAIPETEFRMRENFETIISTLDKNLRRRFNDREVRILHLLSLLQDISIKGVVALELKLICQLFEDDLPLNSVEEAIDRFKEAGVIQIKGFYAEVVPPVFANSLAVKLLCNKKTKLLALFAALSQDGRLRLIQRLRELKQRTVAWFWDEMFSPNGLFRDLSTALLNGEIFRLVASAVPNKVANFLQTELESLSLEQRRLIQYSQRETLVWVLEELIFRTQTSLQAFYWLKLLAETEVEHYESNSAMSRFCQCFQPLHPQVPLPIKPRLEFLKGFFSSTASIESQLLGVEVIKTILNRYGYSFLHEIGGAEPIDAMPSMTWDEVWNYREELLILLIEVVQSDESRVAEAAKQTLPSAIAEFAILQFSPDATIKAFQTIVDWILSHQIEISVSQVSEALKSVYDFYINRSKKVNKEIEIDYKKFLQKISDLLRQFDIADFAVRLKQWTGCWTRNHSYKLDKNGDQIYRGNQEPQNLAKEVIKQPELLTEELLLWLCSKDAQEAQPFCHWLGKLDIERRWLQKIEEVGIQENGVIVFSAYLGGSSQINPSFVSERLDQLTELGNIKPKAIIVATIHLYSDLRGLKRLKKLIGLGQEIKDCSWINYLISGECRTWINSLHSNDYLTFLKVIVGSEMEYVALVIEFFYRWKQPIEGELADFAWRCLEAVNTRAKEFEADQLAYKLAQADIERGFLLLEKLLLKPYDHRCWNPINCYGYREFWNILYKADCKRAVYIALSCAVEDPLLYSLITLDISTVVNQEFDSASLIAFALENETQAVVVCRCLLEEQANFWSIAFPIIERYPDHDEIQRALSNRLLENIGWGSRLENLEKCVEKLKKKCQQSETSYHTRLSLEKLIAFVQTQIENECNIEIQQLNQNNELLTEHSNNGQIWAIETLLRIASVEEIEQVLSQNELLSILPKLKLSHCELNKLQKIFTK